MTIDSTVRVQYLNCVTVKLLKRFGPIYNLEQNDYCFQERNLLLSAVSRNPVPMFRDRDYEDDATIRARNHELFS